MATFVLVLALPGQGYAQAPPPDEPVPGGHFYRQTGGGNGLGFAITDADGMPFWSTFQQLGGTAALGYPISRRFVRQGFTYQATQVGVLQYRPDSGTVVLANIFEWLEQAGRDPWLKATKGIPAPMGDGATSFDEAVEIRMSWLTDEAIKQRYLAPPSDELAAGWGRNQAMQLYGLPASRPEKAGPYIAQRFQRIAFQHWVDTAPGLPAVGTITPVLGGDLLKEAEVLTGLAIVPHAIDESAPVVVPPTATPTPAATAVPAATPKPPPPALTGKIVYERNFAIWQMNGDGSNQHEIVPFGLLPALSRNGAKIVFMGPRTSRLCCAIWTVDGSGHNLTPLTKGPFDVAAAWSPDATRLVYTSTSGGGLKVYIMAANGAGKSLLLDWPTLVGLSWSPDGSKLVFSSIHENTRGIYTVPIAGGSPFRLTREQDQFPVWSPDGTKIAFQSRRDDNWEIYVMNADGTNVRRLTNHAADDHGPAWSPDGFYIAFVSERTADEQPDIFIMEAADGSNVRNITNTPDSYEDSPTWSLE